MGVVLDGNEGAAGARGAATRATSTPCSPSLARAHNVAFYPDLLAGVGRNRALNQPDGIHPNAQGVAIIARGLAPVVAKVLASRP